jgi:hypothetical protein
MRGRVPQGVGLATLERFAWVRCGLLLRSLHRTAQGYGRSGCRRVLRRGGEGDGHQVDLPVGYAAVRSPGALARCRAATGARGAGDGRPGSPVGHWPRLPPSPVGQRPSTMRTVWRASRRRRRLSRSGVRWSIATAPERKAPATADLIMGMLRHCPDTLAGKRDRVLIALGFAGAFRRSELVAPPAHRRSLRVLTIAQASSLACARTSDERNLACSRRSSSLSVHACWINQCRGSCAATAPRPGG